VSVSAGPAARTAATCAARRRGVGQRDRGVRGERRAGPVREGGHRGRAVGVELGQLLPAVEQLRRERAGLARQRRTGADAPRGLRAPGLELRETRRQRRAPRIERRHREEGAHDLLPHAVQRGRHGGLGLGELRAVGRRRAGRGLGSTSARSARSDAS
jgi:hypothetical protein